MPQPPIDRRVALAQPPQQLAEAVERFGTPAPPRSPPRTHHARPPSARRSARARVEWRVLGSELEAALEELRLIRELEPPANARGRRKEHGLYLKRRGEDFVVSRRPRPAGADRKPPARFPCGTRARLKHGRGARRPPPGWPLPRLRARLSHLAENLRYEEAARLPDVGIRVGSISRRAPCVFRGISPPRATATDSPHRCRDCSVHRTASYSGVRASRWGRSRAPACDDLWSTNSASRSSSRSIDSDWHYAPRRQRDAFRWPERGAASAQTGVRGRSASHQRRPRGLLCPLGREPWRLAS